MQCPACSQTMHAEAFDGHYGRTVALDLCFTCAVIWFDGHESLALAPGAVLRMFTLIHEHQAERQPGALASPACPRCYAALTETHDVQRNVRFTYWNCLQRHGRLTNFVEFLREKSFVRPLAPAELAKLRENVQTIHCDGCGAPIDLEHGSTCTFCGAAVSTLDAHQVDKIVHELQAAEAERQTIDPALPARLVMDRLDVDRFYSEQNATAAGDRGSGSYGLVALGLASLAGFLAVRD